MRTDANSDSHPKPWGNTMLTIEKIAEQIGTLEDEDEAQYLEEPSFVVEQSDFGDDEPTEGGFRSPFDESTT